MGWCADAGAPEWRRARGRRLAWRRLLLGSALLLLAWPAAARSQPAPAGGTGADADAAAWTPGPGIELRVRRAVAERWGVEPGVVRLEWTAASPDAALADDAAFELVGSGAGGIWWLSVRDAEGAAMRVRVRAGVEGVEPVAARRLERGIELTAADISQATVVHWGEPPADAPAVGAGWVTRRVIAAGEPLRPPAVAPPLLVSAGDLVQVIVRRGAVELTLRARATGAAAAGERVPVRTDAGRRLQGIAVARGVVRID